MIFILDAYNVIHKIRWLEAKLNRDLRSARDGLVSLCNQIMTSRGGITEMILVFDGKSQYHDLPQISPPKIKLVFSDTDEDADDRIKTILEHLGSKRKCVVSDDNHVRNHARAYKAQIMPVAEFERLMDTGSSQKKQATSERPALSPEIAKQITDAYRKTLGL